MVAWVLTVGGGPTVTVEADGCRVAVWGHLDDAVHRLDTFIDGPDNTFLLLPPEGSAQAAP